MSAVELLGQAQRVLTGEGAEGLTARLAAFLARQALEEVIGARCVAVGASAVGANTRSKLLVLRALDEREIADQAALAWSRLSVACHVHAFEMQPSVAEVEHLCEMVAGIATRP